MAAAVVTSMAGDDRCVMMAAMVATGDGCCGGGVMVTAVMVSRLLRISRRGGVMVAPVMVVSRRGVGGRRCDVVMAVVHPSLGRPRGQGYARQGERSGPTKSKGSGGPEGLVHVSLLPGRSLRPAAPGASE